LAKKLGDYLVVSPGTINNAIKRSFDAYTKGRPSKRLGEILQDMGVISQEDLDTALRLQRIDRLSRCPLFASLPNTDLAALSNHFAEVSYPPWEKFIKQGEFDPILYVVAEGRVQVFTMDKSGKEVSVAEVGEGEPIGEMGYFSGGVRTASVRTLGPVQLLRAEYNDLTNYFERAESVALAFMQVVNQRRRELEQIKEQA
jgi:CRP-like cAMP-binding protein